MNRRYLYALLGASLITVGAIAYAEKDETPDEPANDAVPVTTAPVSLVQAVQAAEQRTAGKARQAEYTHTREGWVYDVEVVSGTRVFDVRVDARSGNVMSSAEDKPDHGERHHDDKD